MVGDFSELEDEEGGNIWMQRFGQRLAWADGELSDIMVRKLSKRNRIPLHTSAFQQHAKGLDPALPHYS